MGRDLTVDRTLTVSGAQGASPTLTVTGSLSLATVAGNSRITFGGETTLFRERANVLKTGLDFIVGGSLGVSGDGVLTTSPTLTVTGSLALNLVNGAVGITFGGDASLLRSAANTLRVGQDLTVGRDLTVDRVLTVSGAQGASPTLTVTGSLSLAAVAGNSGITFGGETTLFRERANVLKTGLDFIVGGSLGISGDGVLTTSPTLTVTGSLALNLANGTTGITFGGDASLLRSAANTLRVGQDLVVGRDLTVDRTLTVIGALGASPTLTVTGSLLINGANGPAGITFSADTTLFREQAGVLKTGNDLIVGGSLLIAGAGGLGTGASLTVTEAWVPEPA